MEREVKYHTVDYSIKRVIKRGLEKGTYYKVFTTYSDGYRSFYGWLTRKEVKYYFPDIVIADIIMGHHE